MSTASFQLLQPGASNGHGGSSSGFVRGCSVRGAAAGRHCGVGAVPGSMMCCAPESVLSIYVNHAADSLQQMSYALSVFRPQVFRPQAAAHTGNACLTHHAAHSVPAAAALVRSVPPPDCSPPPADVVAAPAAPRTVEDLFDELLLESDVGWVQCIARQ